MKLGYINYLNCFPFYFHMFLRQPVSGVDVVPGYPSALNRMMAQKGLDMSAVSSGALPDICDDVYVVPDFCLSSIGYIESVILRSTVPIEELDKKQVGITSASRTSEVLLKTLLHRYYHADPIYHTTPPNSGIDGMDAVLLIGNEAMVQSRQPVQFSYDLGELWLRKTGFPVVFAVFVVGKKTIETHAPLVAEVIESYRKSLHCLEEEEDVVVAAAKERYPDVIYDVRSYYRLFRFEFRDELKQALKFYLDAGFESGFFSRRAQLSYLDLEGF